MKYYALKDENNKLIYENWVEAKEALKGLKAPKYKSFKTKEEAEAFLEGKELEIDYKIPTAYIDGSYDKETENYSFGGCLFIDGNIYKFKKKYLKDEYSSFRNVAGEIKGAGYIINYAINHGIKELNIYYDYLGIEKWYKGEWQAKSPIAIEYVNYANEAKKKINVNFIKIKSHTNNKYNDLADTLAKEALK
ncbi:MAG: ribonuclease H family protein [Acholeplasmatales bacterium]|nr:ribonuclease H family protein [Acholeplasmatales bacterium]